VGEFEEFTDRVADLARRKGAADRLSLSLRGAFLDIVSEPPHISP
jgi:hypothetical protein